MINIRNEIMYSRNKLFLVLLREYRTKSINRNANPGIQRRIKIFSEGSPELEKLNLSESSLEDGEIDFNSASEFYNHYERETKQLKKKIEFKRIERKYFTPKKNPNLLTWAEKEQIKHLYNTDPATWTPEKLSLSFPATVDIIMKILKSQWAPKNPERIKKHDEAVTNNWKAFERGELKLYPDFESHIKTFISRKERENIDIPENVNGMGNKDNSRVSRLPQSTEFLNIIKSYKNKNISENSVDTAIVNVQDSRQESDCETKPLEVQNKVPYRRRYYTLDELRNEVKNSSVSKSEEQAKIDEHFIQGVNKENVRNAVSVESKGKNDLSVFQKFEGTKSHNTSNQFVEENDNDMLRISIPDKKKKKGCIYKVKDCYYDEHGDFLFKVPGMS